jgi:hypothetical protein
MYEEVNGRANSEAYAILQLRPRHNQEPNILSVAGPRSKTLIDFVVAQSKCLGVIKGHHSEARVFTSGRGIAPISPV